MVFCQSQCIAASVLLWEEMSFIWTLATFFKPEFEFGTGFKIPYQFILDYFRDYRLKVARYCGAGPDCGCYIECRGHKFLFFLDELTAAIYHAVEEEKVLYRYWFFDNLKFKKEKKEIYGREVLTDLCLNKWDFIPLDPRDLKGKTYSQRVSLLH